jgi:hypothetical protein
MSNPNAGAINFLQWNPRSILAIKQHLLDLVRENEIHVIALCDTWLRSSDCLFIPGFDVIRWDRPGKHGSWASEETWNLKKF